MRLYGCTLTGVATTVAFEVDVSDVEYQPSQLARIYRPRGAGPFPTVVDVHGGAWNTGDRSGGPEALQPSPEPLVGVGVGYQYQ